MTHPWLLGSLAAVVIAIALTFAACLKGASDADDATELDWYEQIQ